MVLFPRCHRQFDFSGQADGDGFRGDAMSTQRKESYHKHINTKAVFYYLCVLQFVELFKLALKKADPFSQRLEMTYFFNLIPLQIMCNW